MTIEQYAAGLKQGGLKGAKFDLALALTLSGHGVPNRPYRDGRAYWLSQDEFGEPVAFEQAEAILYLTPTPDGFAHEWLQGERYVEWRTEPWKAQTVTIQVGHASHAPHGQPYATPIGWTPKAPASVPGAVGELAWTDGALWDETEEVAGLIWATNVDPAASEGDEVEVPLSDLAWVASGQYRHLGDVEIG